jgi:hypothetical protein
MSKILVDTIDTRSGTSNITIGSSNASQITLKSGATLTNFPDNTPSFMAGNNNAQAIGQNQSISNDTETLMIFPQEIYDTDNTYDTSTNRFTPTVAGKYYVYANMRFNTATDFELCELRVQKNNSTVLEKTWRNEYFTGVYIGGAVDMNGSSDYIDVKIYQSSGSSQDVTGYQSITYFGAYKIIGA